MECRIFGLILGGVLLLGCVDPEARPYEEYVADYERLQNGTFSNNQSTNNQSNGTTNQNTANQTNNGSNNAYPCSPDGGASIDITIRNATEYPADLFWVAFDCEELQYGTLLPDQVRSQQTFVGHVWILKIINTTLAWGVVEEGTTELVLGEE